MKLVPGHLYRFINKSDSLICIEEKQLGCGRHKSITQYEVGQVFLFVETVQPWKDKLNNKDKDIKLSKISIGDKILLTNAEEAFTKKDLEEIET